MKCLSGARAQDNIPNNIIGTFFFFQDFVQLCDSRKIHYQTHEFCVKSHAKIGFRVLFKVTGHSFQVPMPNSPLLLNYLRLGALFFFARIKLNQRRVYSHSLVKVCAVAMATGLVKNKT